MSAGEQLALFEAQGAELAALAVQALRGSKRCECIAAVCEDMGVLDAVAQMERAAVFDTCYQLETLAGLA